MDRRSEGIGRALAALPKVRAVALGGSRSATHADARSDIDLYTFGDPAPPVDARAWLIEERRPSHVELDNQWFGTGDEWIEPDGMAVDAMHWSARWIEDEVANTIDHHRPKLGYTTAILYTLANCMVLHDPEGWLVSIQQRIERYPDELAQAIIAHNLPLLAGTQHCFARQIEVADERTDRVAYNHRVAAFLASAFDVLFAMNRRFHPGEKRLLDHAAKLDRVPVNFSSDVHALIAGEAAAAWRIAEALRH